jgi:hypothetical protein
VAARSRTDPLATARYLSKKNPTFPGDDSHRILIGHDERHVPIQSPEQNEIEKAARNLPIAAASLALLVVPGPALAAATSTSAVSSGLWAYAHFFSILLIVGCLTAERIIVRADMTTAEEDQIVKIDLVYGLMAALLIISGFARATNFGKGGDFYIHEPLFWAKMTFSGIWGGLSLFPSCKYSLEGTYVLE